MHVGGRETAVAMTRLAAHKDKQLADFLVLYDELSGPQREDAGLLERLCLAVGMHPADYFGKISAVAYRYNYDAASLAAAAAAPLVIEKATEFAQDKGGFKDRELVLKAAKILETGPLVKVEQTQQNVNVSSNLPSLGQLSGRVSELVRGQLPEAPIAVDAEIIESTLTESEPVLAPTNGGPDKAS